MKRHRSIQFFFVIICLTPVICFAQANKQTESTDPYFNPYQNKVSDLVRSGEVQTNALVPRTTEPLTNSQSYGERPFRPGSTSQNTNDVEDLLRTKLPSPTDNLQSARQINPLKPTAGFQPPQTNVIARDDRVKLAPARVDQFADNDFVKRANSSQNRLQPNSSQLPSAGIVAPKNYSGFKSNQRVGQAGTSEQRVINQRYDLTPPRQQFAEDDNQFRVAAPVRQSRTVTSQESQMASVGFTNPSPSEIDNIKKTTGQFSPNSLPPSTSDSNSEKSQPFMTVGEEQYLDPSAEVAMSRGTQVSETQNVDSKTNDSDFAQQSNGVQFQEGQVVAIVGGDPIFVGDMIFEANQVMDRFNPNAPRKIRDRDRPLVIKKLLPKFVEARMRLLDVISGLRLR